MKILSFDVEEWYIEKQFNGNHSERYREFDNYLCSILDILDHCNVKATFFCLGKVATDFPYVVKAIASRGHEIGCHSNEHLWLTKMTPAQLRADTHDALAALQDVVGEKVVSYRAPAFSIGEGNKWALEILAEEGIEKDASIFPAKRDFGGFASFPVSQPVLITSGAVSIKEFPIGLTSVMGKQVAYSGGGYFRLFPYSFIHSRINSNNYGMTYFHIDDLMHKSGGLMTRSEYETYFRENGSLKNRIVRYLKSNIGTKGAFDKMSKLIKNNDFLNLKDADSIIDWSKSEMISL